MSPSNPPRKTPWKPPLGLLALDVFGIVLLAVGLLMHFSPEAALVRGLPPTFRLPLLIVGGTMAAAGWLGLVASVLAHRRPG
ncbi:MAG: hypothetical protein ACOY82_19550 [Pseudomonadota bacterium]